jgi:nitrous oxide reductase accessory protein NosL
MRARTGSYILPADVVSGLGAAEPVPPRDELAATDLAARDLDRLERYERRALSRRKRAIETFMAINHLMP